MFHCILILLTTLCLATAPVPIHAADAEPTADSADAWPLVAPDGHGGELRLFYPQVESLTGDRITARAAFSLSTGDQNQPAFGVVWLAARAVIDRDARTVALDDQQATKVHLPGASDADEASISATVTRLIRDMDPVLSLDRVVTALEEAEHDRRAAEDLDAGPPKIITVAHPATLLYVDGPPLGAPLDGSRFERIQNTPSLLVRDPADGAFWLLYGGRWYGAPAIDGPWAVATRVSDEVAALAAILQGSGQSAPSDDPVDIVVSQEPAELISSDGPPAYAPIQDTGLLAVTNSDNDLFLDTGTQQHYVLLAGRWFRTRTLARGPWEPVPPTALPRDFSRIPSDSPYGSVLAHVPGTPAATEAALDAQVPQTAAVKRDASITVPYDGDPQWQPIPQTSLSYAVNTPLAVIRAGDGAYYCCAQGVWYRAPSPSGPWIVAVALPPDVDRIPPDNPLYNVRYVYIYDTTPDYVNVGYLPGYLGCYVVHGCVVWGTGFHYRCRWDGRYFPRPCTWGFGMAYDRWTGHWGARRSSGFGGVTGGFAGTVSAGHGGWWGPAGYQPVSVWRHPRGTALHGIDQHRSSQPLASPSGDNLYHRPENRDRVRPLSHHPPSEPAGGQRRPPGSREAERVVPGRDGEVFRRAPDGWQQWRRDGWRPLAADDGPPVQTPAAAPLSPPQREETPHRGDAPPAAAPRRDEPPRRGDVPPAAAPQRDETPRRGDAPPMPTPNPPLAPAHGRPQTPASAAATPAPMTTAPASGIRPPATAAPAPAAHPPAATSPAPAVHPPQAAPPAGTAAPGTAAGDDRPRPPPLMSPPRGTDAPPPPDDHRPVIPPLRQPSRVEQLDHQQRLDDRGIERFREFQSHRGDASETPEQPPATAPKAGPRLPRPAAPSH